MGIYQTNEYVTFATEFTSGGELKSGLTVSVQAYSPAYGGNAYNLTNATATEIVAGAGIYQYKMTVGDFNAVAYCVFSTTDPTVDKKVIVVQAQIAPVWVQHLDQNISSLPSASAVGVAVWGRTTNDTPLVQPNSFGRALANVAQQDSGNPIASAVWGTESDAYRGYEGVFGSLLANPAPPPPTTDPLNAVLPGAYAPNTVGAALFRNLTHPALVAANTPTVLPVTLDTKTVRRGDSYEAPEGRDLRWTIPGLPVTWNYTGATAQVSVGQDGSGLLFPRTQAQIITADPITGTLVVSLALTSTITNTLEPGTYLFDIEIDFVDTHPVTVGAGQFVVTADVR